MVFECEKILNENGDKLDESDKSEITAKVDALKEALKGDDLDAIKAKQEDLQKKFYDISEKLYKAANPQGGAQGFDPNAAAGFNPGAGPDDGYQEAPFTDVKD